MVKGWHRESSRHSLAAKGVRSAKDHTPSGIASANPKNRVLQDAMGGKLKSNRLPIQASITVPSTKDNKRISPEEFQKRIDTTKKFMDNTFGGDTTIRGVGSYTQEGDLIKEKVAVVESSMTNKDFQKNSKEIGKFVKDKKNKWKQDSIAYEVEGDLYIYPKKDFISHEPKKDKRLQV